MILRTAVDPMRTPGKPALARVWHASCCANHYPHPRRPSVRVSASSSRPFLCMHCGRAMLILQTITRGKTILPRGLSDTCPQVGADRRAGSRPTTLNSHDRSGTKPSGQLCYPKPTFPPGRRQQVLGFHTSLKIVCRQVATDRLHRRVGSVREAHSSTHLGTQGLHAGREEDPIR